MTILTSCSNIVIRHMHRQCAEAKGAYVSVAASTLGTQPRISEAVEVHTP